MICHFLNLSKVKILPKAADQAKEPLSKGPYSDKYTSKGNLKPPSLGGDPIKLVYTSIILVDFSFSALN